MSIRLGGSCAVQPSPACLKGRARRALGHVCRGGSLGSLVLSLAFWAVSSRGGADPTLASTLRFPGPGGWTAPCSPPPSPRSREPQVRAALAGPGHLQVWRRDTSHVPRRWSPATPTTEQEEPPGPPAARPRSEVRCSVSLLCQRPALPWRPPRCPLVLVTGSRDGHFKAAKRLPSKREKAPGPLWESALQASGCG